MTAATVRRASLLGFAAWALAACIPATDPGTRPIVAASITTPAPPTYRYSWVMVHDWQHAGFQIGPKVDGSGIHVAVYWWESCAAPYTPCTRWGFHEYQPLEAGSTHDYAITKTATGYAAWCDGQLVTTVDLVIEDPHTAVDSEITTS